MAHEQNTPAMNAVAEVKPVEMTDVSISVPKHAKEMADGLGKFVGALKATLADGFDISKDLAPILTTVMADLIPATKNFATIVDDVKASPVATVVAFLLAAEEAIKK